MILIIICYLLREMFKKGALSMFTKPYVKSDGILDFIKTEKSRAYDAIAEGYDWLLEGKNIIARLYNSVVWGISNEDYVNKLLKLLTDDFDGTMLDVPVGTALFIAQKYDQMKLASIIAMDYSGGMLLKAKERLCKINHDNITLIRGDVGNIPIDDNSVDGILSMNGFHAFPDKQAAIREFSRVIHPGGFLIACFYIKGQRRFTDWFIKKVYTKQGSFVPPFYTKEEIKDLFSADYTFEFLDNVKSILYFKAIRK